MENQERRLSRIATQWSIVQDLHGIEPDAVRAAQTALLERYGDAVRRYLLGALRDVEAANELFQEFALKFVRGDFQRASPDLGRFRDYLKGVVFRLIMDHHRRKGRDAKRVDLPMEDAVEPSGPQATELDEAFVRSWRDQLLSRSWDQLSAFERASGKPFYTVLRARVDEPEADSTMLAEILSQRVGKKITSDHLRVLLHRARDLFAERLMEEVSHSLHDPSHEMLEQELIALDLHRYCRKRLKDMGR